MYLQAAKSFLLHSVRSKLRALSNFNSLCCGPIFAAWWVAYGRRWRRRETQGLHLLLAEGFRRVRRRTGGGTRTCWLRAIPRPPRHRGRRGLGGAPRRPDYAIRHGSVCRLAGSGQVRAVHLGGGPDVRALKEGLAGCLQVGAGCRNSTQTEGTAIYPLPYRARRDAPFARTS